MDCSNYYISIIDTQADPDDSYVVTGYVNPGYFFPQHEEGGFIGAGELVAARSIQLSHRGGDRLDVPIIGSSLSWTFVGLDCRDGRYQQLFTGDENRFKVILRDENDEIIWSGFLLPDAYQEPYRNYIQDVSFEAVDGLGRLKGKFLDYLPNEVSVVELISRALRLTGLNLNLMFSPAIVNYTQEDFKQIWLDAETLRGRDAYDTLYGLATSLGSSVFQIDNKWYFEGWNFRNQRVLPYTEYNFIGTFQQAGTFYKNVKDVTVLSGGNVETVPPLGRIEVSYQKELPMLSAELFSVQDQDWIDYEGAADNNEVYARAWLMPEDTPIWASKEKGVYFTPEIVEIEPREPGRYDPEDPPREPAPDQTAAGSYSIADRPYLIEGYLYRLTFSLRLVVSLKNPPEEGEAVDAYVFGNPLVRATLGGQHLSGFPFTGAVVKEYTYARPSDSSGTTVINEQEGELGSLEFRAQNSGLLNIEIFRLIGLSLFGSDSRELDEFEFEMFVDEISIENIDDVPTTDVAVRDNSEEFTTTKTVELSFAGDPSGSPGAFRLNRTDASVNVEVFSNLSRRHFKLEDFWYFIVDLKTAYLVDKYRDNVYDSLNNKIDIEDVEFNWTLSQEHAIITKTLLRSAIGFEPRIYVRVPHLIDVEQSRAYWNAWGSAHYRIEQKPFVEAQAELLQRLFAEAEIRFTGGVWDNLKINDIIRFQYKGETHTLNLTSCDWDIDAGSTQIVASRPSTLAQDLPPAVEVSQMNYLNPNQIHFEAEATSPAGDIVSFEWSLVDGDGTFSDTSVSDPLFTFSGIARVRVEVVDNHGNVGFDEVFVYEKVAVRVSPPNSGGSLPSGVGGDPDGLIRTIPINFTGYMPEEYVIDVSGTVSISTPGNINDDWVARFYENDSIKIVINGQDILLGDPDLEPQTVGQWGALAWVAPFSVSLRASDVAEIVITADPDRSSAGVPPLRYSVINDLSQFVIGYGTIAGAPSREDRPDPRPGERPGGSGTPPRRG